MLFVPAVSGLHLEGHMTLDAFTISVIVSILLDKIPGVSCRIVVLCDKQRQVRIHLPGSMFRTLMATAG